jgi:hypothetical protein
MEFGLQTLAVRELSVAGVSPTLLVSYILIIFLQTTPTIIAGLMGHTAECACLGGGRATMMGPIARARLERFMLLVDVCCDVAYSTIPLIHLMTQIISIKYAWF